MKPCRMTKYALWLASFIARASRWQTLGFVNWARDAAANARSCYKQLRYHLDRYTRQAVKA